LVAVTVISPRRNSVVAGRCTGRELTAYAEPPGGRPGTRPWAWWVFDRGFEDEPDPSTAVAYLAEHGLLTEWEREALAGSI
jgi:hypothetical protein